MVNLYKLYPGNYEYGDSYGWCILVFAATRNRARYIAADWAQSNGLDITYYEWRGRIVKKAVDYHETYVIDEPDDSEAYAVAKECGFEWQELPEDW